MANNRSRGSMARLFRFRPLVEILEDRFVPATISVTTLGDGPGVLTDLGGGNYSDTTLRGAVNAADSGAATPGPYTITFSAGLAGPLDLATAGDNSAGPSALLASAAVTIDGNNGGAGITLDRAAAAPGMRLFLVNGTGNLTIRSLTLTGGKLTSNGHPNGSGGAVLVQGGGTLTLNNSILTGNTVTGGANAYGGALYLAQNATASLTATTVSNNSGNYGGGITTRGTLTLDGCTVSGNTCPFFGGGGVTQWAPTGPTTIVNSTVSGNKATNAGTGYGGGLVVGGGTLNVTNSTIAGNTSSGGGGGALRVKFGTCTLANTLVAGNTDNSGNNRPDIVGTVTANYCLIGNPAGATFSGASGNNLGQSGGPLDARLDPAGLADHGGPTQTIALQAGSPALDAGSNALAAAAGLSTDQRGPGFARLVHAAGPGGTQTTDIGAFEAQPSLSSIATQTTPAGSTGSVTFNVGDAALDTFSFTAISDNQTVLPDANLSVSGSGSSRTLSFTPVAAGVAHVTVTVSATVASTTQSMSTTFALVSSGQIVVTTLGDGPGVLTPLGNGNYSDTTLRGAVNAADSAPIPYTITFSAGLAGPLDLATAGDNSAGPSALLASAAVTIDGNNGGAGITLDRAAAAPGMRLFLVNGTGNLTIRSLTLTGGKLTSNGHPNGSGGAVLVQGGGTLTLNNSILTGNTVTGGANAYGGALYLAQNATASLTATTVSNNSGNYGGGITTRGTLTLDGCTVSGNTCPFFGGGGVTQWAPTGPTTIVNSTVSGNKATNAGTGYGGGLVVGGGTLNVTNSTIAGNTSSGGGGGALRVKFGTCTLANTLVAGNTDNSGNNRPDIVGTVTANYCLIGNPAGATFSGASGNNLGQSGGPLDARLDPAGLADHGGPTQTIALQAGSPALDAGSNALAAAAGLSTDQRGPGFPRVVNGTVDIGAFEVQPSTMSVTLVSGTLTVTDTTAGGADDNVTLQTDGTQFLITNPVSTLSTPIAGASVSNGGHTVSVPFNGTTTVTAASAIAVNTLAGNDTVTVDCSLGNFTDTIGYDGGTGANSLILSGGTFTKAQYDYTDAHTGDVKLTTASGTATVNYRNLAPIHNTGTITDAVFNLPASAGASLEDSGTANDGVSQLRSTNSTFELTTFSNPSGTLTVQGAGSDTVGLAAMDNGFAPTGESFSGLAGDLFQFQAAGAVPGTTSVTLTTATLDLNGQSPTVGGLNGTGTVTNGVTGTNTLTVNNGGSFSGVIQDGGNGKVTALTVAGGILILTGTNTYSGTTTINSGTPILQVGNGAAAGTLGSGGVTDNGSLTFDRTDTVTVANAISGGGSLSVKGGMTLILTGGNSYGTTGIASGNTLQVGNGGTAGALGSGTVTDNGALVFDRSDSLSVNNLISGSGSVTQADGGTTTLGNGSNSYAGATTISGGILSVGTLANGGSNSGIGASTNAATNLVLDGGTLRYTGAGVTTDRLFSVGTGGATIDAGGTGALVFSNTGTLGFNGQTGTRTLTLADVPGPTFVNVQSAEIDDNGGATTLTKIQGGKWSLTNTNNNFSGPTNVNGGTLFVNGADKGTGTVTIANTAILGGSGTVAGAVSVQNGGTVSPGNSPGILGTGSVTFAANATHPTYVEEINGSAPGNGSNNYDRLNVTGTATLNGATFNVSLASGFMPTASTQFVIVHTTGGVTGQFDKGTSVTLNGIPFTISYNVNNQDVVLQKVAPTTVYVDDDWAGTTAGTDPATDPVGGLSFGYNAFATIQGGLDNVAANGTVFVYGGSYHEAVNVNQALTKIETDTNSFFPAQTVVTVSQAVTVGAATTFAMNTADLTFSSAVDDATAGADSLTVNGAGHTVTFGGVVGGGTPLKSLTAVATTGTTILQGGVVKTTGDQTYDNAVQIAADTTLTDGGTGIVFGSTVDGDGNGPWALTATTTAAAAQIQFNGTVGGGHPLKGLTVNDAGPASAAAIKGAGTTLTKQGAGTFTLSNTNTYSGATTLGGGTLQVDGSIVSAVALSGGTLAGTGSTGAVSATTGGAVSPGDGAPGVLNVGAVTWNASITFNVELGGTSPGNGSGFYDQLVAAGAVHLANATLNLSALGGLTPSLGQKFTILKNNSGSAIPDTFQGLPEGSVVSTGFGGGLTLLITYKGGASGHDVVLSVATDAAAVIGGNLVVFGSNGSDNLVVTYSGGAFNVNINGTSFPFSVGAGTGQVSASGRVLIDGYDGNDNITVQGTFPAEIHAGNGTTTVHGGDGGNVIYGGSATTARLTAYAGAGSDVLIGGAGTATLYGGRGKAVLIGGSLKPGMGFDTYASLVTLAQVWAGTAPAGSPTVAQEEAALKLAIQAGAADTLYAGTGATWGLATPASFAGGWASPHKKTTL